MKCFKVAIGLAAVAVLAVPSAASAHSNPSISSVRQHIRSADQALTMVAEHVEHNSNAAAAIAMARNLSQTNAASRDSARISGRSMRAKAWRLVAAQRNDNAETLADLSNEVSGKTQVRMATALSSNLSGRETALAKLRALLPTLPPAARFGISKAIAAISGYPEDEVVDIAVALDSRQVTAAATPQLQRALTLASSAMFTGLDRLKQIVGMLPGPAQGPVNRAIARVNGILVSIFGDGGSTGGPTGMLRNLPIPANVPVPCGLPIPKFLPFARDC